MNEANYRDRRCHVPRLIVYTNNDTNQAKKYNFLPDQYRGWCKQHSKQPWDKKMYF